MSPAFALRGRRLGEAVDSGHNHFHALRLVAAWLVIYGHAWAITAAPGQDLVLQLVQLKFAGGVAVDAFFLVSGFLVTASLERHSVPRFLAARALRLLPGLWTCLLLSVAGLALLGDAPGYARAALDYVLTNGDLRTTAYFLPGVFEDHPNAAINGSLWSLPVEARLYLLLAIAGLLGLMRGLRFEWLYLGLLPPLAVMHVAFGEPPLRPDYANYAYCAAFFATGAFAWRQRARIVLAWPLLLAALGLAWATQHTAWMHLGYGVALAYGVLFIAHLPGRPWIRRHDVSYGLYLYGWPAGQLAWMLVPGPHPLLNTAIATAIALPLAIASWHLVEAPALTLKPRPRPRPAEAAPAPAPAQAADAPPATRAD